MAAGPLLAALDGGEDGMSTTAQFGHVARTIAVAASMLAAQNLDAKALTQDDDVSFTTSGGAALKVVHQGRFSRDYRILLDGRVVWPTPERPGPRLDEVFSRADYEEMQANGRTYGLLAIEDEILGSGVDRSRTVFVIDLEEKRYLFFYRAFDFRRMGAADILYSLARLDRLQSYTGTDILRVSYLDIPVRGCIASSDASWAFGFGYRLYEPLSGGGFRQTLHREVPITDASGQRILFSGDNEWESAALVAARAVTFRYRDTVRKALNRYRRQVDGPPGYCDVPINLERRDDFRRLFDTLLGELK